jgi:hypothetical protein
MLITLWARNDTIHYVVHEGRAHEWQDCFLLRELYMLPDPRPAVMAERGDDRECR